MDWFWLDMDCKQGSFWQVWQVGNNGGVAQTDGKTTCVLTGTRADDKRMYPSKPGQHRDFMRAFPLLDLGYGLRDVNRILIEAGIGIPVYYNWKRRSGCWCCPFQSTMAWRNLLRYHPELFAKAEEWQRAIDKRFETGKQRAPFYLPYLGRMHLAKIREIEESQQRMVELL